MSNAALISQRAVGLPGNPFAEADARAAAAIAAGEDVIDLSKGNPDGQPPAFVDWLLKTAGVALMPGSCFGKAGEGWVRISLLKHTAELFQAAARVSRVLQDK